jgi:SAM-dependent methyltransferase
LNDAVRAQYEQWVYPKPIADLADPRQRGVRDASDPSLLGAAYWPDRPRRKDLRILVAGCGANAAPRLAFHNRDATVVGIDISEASLEHSRRLKAKHKLENLTLRRLRIEDAADLNQTFDLIETTGVLHHLPEPLAGLKALSRLLRSDGVVYLMLYGKYGRTGVYMAQELFRLLGAQQTPGDVAFVKKSLEAFKADHVLRSYTARAHDINFDAGLVDTFLHPQDRAYTVAQCLELVEEAGLAFQGWAENFLYYPEGQVPRNNPLYERIRGLPDPMVWQVMELFHGRIAKHSFFACRKDRDPSTYRVAFDDDRFMAMVPLLRCTPAVTREGNVVLRRAPYPRIVLEKRPAALVRAIDGKRTVRACLEAAGIKAASPVTATALCREVVRELWR